MCGILGLASPHETVDFRLALGTLKHRGPDQQTVWQKDNVTLGHARLSINDLSEAGNQPFLSQSEDLAVIVNGEIYNSPDLRAILSQTGTRFQGTSDCEVLLHGYRDWGLEKLLEKIEGMFAGCIVDLSKKKIFLFRDRAGMKPLFYSANQDGLYFGSEIDAVRAILPRGLTENKYALYDFLTYKYIPGKHTLWNEINQIKPAHLLMFNIETNEIESNGPYWKLEPQVNDRLTLDKASSDFMEILERSVKSHLLSDLPVCYSLSAGLDSSIITALGSKNNSETRPNTFTMGINHDTDESAMAGRFAAELNANHTLRQVKEQAKDDPLQFILSLFGQPFGDLSLIPTYQLFKLMKQEYTVAITGDGGDELMGGYKRYFKLAELNQSRSTSEKVKFLLGTALINRGKEASRLSRNLLKASVVDEFDYYTLLTNGLTRFEKSTWRKRLEIPQDYDDYWHLRQYWNEHLPIRSRWRHIDFHTYLPDQILTKADRCSMAHSLESRLPYLSKEMIEFSFAIPEKYLFLDGNTKGLVRHSAKSLLPDYLLNRKKTGFGYRNARTLFTNAKHNMPVENILEGYLRMI